MVLSTGERFKRLGPSDDCDTFEKLGASEKELHVLGGELLQRFALVLVEGALDEVGLFLLELDDPGLHRIFNGQARNHTRSLLANTVTAIRALPLSCGIPPAASGGC